MYGAVYKLFNVKYAYLAAIFVFEIGSLVSAVAPTSPAFIVGRAIAGVSVVVPRASSPTYTPRLARLASSPAPSSSSP